MISTKNYKKQYVEATLKAAEAQREAVQAQLDKITETERQKQELTEVAKVLDDSIAPLQQELNDIEASEELAAEQAAAEKKAAEDAKLAAEKKEAKKAEKAKKEADAAANATKELQG